MTIPLILPVFLWGAAIGVTALLGYGGYAYFSEDPEKNKLGILGMHGAGKTRFLSFLRSIPYIEKETGLETYEAFTYRNGDKIIPIDAGIDIGGGNLYRSEYNRILAKSNVIFYFFDISRYLDNNNSSEGISYRRSCNSRIDHIHTVSKTKNFSVIYVGTHLDKCRKSAEAVKSDFFKLIENKSYSSELKKTVFIDLTNNNAIQEFIDKAFK